LLWEVGTMRQQTRLGRTCYIYQVSSNASCNYSQNGR